MVMFLPPTEAMASGACLIGGAAHQAGDQGDHHAEDDDAEDDAHGDFDPPVPSRSRC